MISRYEAPTITDLGTVAELTLGQSDGGFTDQAFPVMTPKPNLTFS